MSDLSMLEQAFALPSATLFVPLQEPPPAPAELQAHEVEFRHLRGPQQIARVLHLRSEIQLPTAALCDDGFVAREKKETRWGWWAPSCGTARRSGPSGSCR